MLSAEALREELARYQSESIYPPSSHRWTEETAGQNQRWDQPFPVEGFLDDEPGRETMLRFASDRHHVQFDGALVSTIEVMPLDRKPERLPVTIHSAMVESFQQGRTGVSLEYRDNGKDGDVVAGDRIYTNRLVPSQHAELSNAKRVRLQADIEANGVRKLAHLDFTFTPRPLLDLVGLRSAIRDGSLGITLDVDVIEAGAYSFTVDVLADDMTPIGWITQPWVELATGRAQVDLELFGKVLRDRGTPGPYVIANIRAEKRADSNDVETWWSDARSFRTAAFALEELSPAPWDSPERRQIITSLERAITAQAAAEAGESLAEHTPRP